MHNSLYGIDFDFMDKNSGVLKCNVNVKLPTFIYLYITENWMYLRFWDTPMLLKPHTGEHLPYSNFEIGKLNTRTNLSSFF